MLKEQSVWSVIRGMKEERETVKTISASTERERQEVRQREEAQEEQLRREERDSRKLKSLEIFERARSAVINILEEVRQNDPDIRRSPVSDIWSGKTYVSEDVRVKVLNEIWLEWGNKFKMTDEEKRMCQKYRKASLFSKDPPSHVPKRIVAHDYFVIIVRIEYSSEIPSGGGCMPMPAKGSVGDVSIGEFLRDPKVIAPYIADGLSSPTHYYRELKPHEDYWLTADEIRRKAPSMTELPWA